MELLVNLICQLFQIYIFHVLELPNSYCRIFSIQSNREEIWSISPTFSHVAYLPTKVKDLVEVIHKTFSDSKQDNQYREYK